jgi:hypothetical protein
MIDSLNEIIEKGALEFGKFDKKNELSTSRVKDLFIHMHPTDERLVFYYQIIKIDYEYEQENPHLFRDLLSLQALGHRFGNLYISFDSDSRLLWLNYSIPLRGIDAVVLKNAVYNFADNADKFGNYIREVIFSQAEEGPQEETSEEIKDNEAQAEGDMNSELMFV